MQFRTLLLSVKEINTVHTQLQLYHVLIDGNIYAMLSIFKTLLRTEK